MLALFLAFLELNFIMVVILLLHRMKHSLGSAVFYLALSMFMIFGQLIATAGIVLDPGFSGTQIYLGNAIILAPFMVAILVVYVVDGTVETQRIVIGLLGILLAYFYLTNVTVNQFDLPGYSGGEDFLDNIHSVFIPENGNMAAAFLAFAADLLLIPIFFQLLHNRISNLFLCVLGTLILAPFVDSIVYHFFSIASLDGWWEVLKDSFLSRIFIAIWLSVLATIYLQMCNVQGRGERRAVDIISAFFGGYTRAMELQRFIHEWEGRYQILVENINDFAFILDPEGAILNANTVAINRLAFFDKNVIGFYLPSLLREVGEDTCDWQAIWAELAEPVDDDIMPVVHREFETTAADGEVIYLDVNISLAQLSDKPVVVMIARDMTERLELQQEREELQEELLHSQRLEGIGQLAGGVAHDFNNYLHAIQGSIERLQMQRDMKRESRVLLNSIEDVANRASLLTSQLLGFARKGKYVNEKLDVNSVMSQVKNLFQTMAKKEIKFKMIIHPVPMYVNGDNTQLQQVFLNLLINARDAIKEKKVTGKIVCRVEPAADYIPGWNMADKDSSPDDYICIRVKDNGIGIPDDMKQKIFDPFFTTKAIGKGTGMGLAMVYGCVANHNGWIFVESELGQKTEFFIFLPRY